MNLEFKRYDLQLAHAWRHARITSTSSCGVVIVKLTASDGCVGLGEAAPVARYRESLESVEGFLRKLDSARLSFDDPAGSMAYVESVSQRDASARCALNVALLDGAAKRARKPLHDFLGLEFREKLHVTSFSIGIDQPDVIRKKVVAARRFPVLKMKVGAPDDLENLRALRAEAPQRPVRVDANEGWNTKEEALAMIERIAADGNIQFVEQPMPSRTPARDWKWLKERSPLPIFADESYQGAEDAERAAECFHGVNVKLVKTGGIASAVEGLRAARQLGLKTMLGCMIETSILISAAAHLAQLCDYLDLDGNLLVTNDPFAGVRADDGVLSFADAPELFGLRVAPRTGRN